MTDIAGRVAIITGGGRGLGRAMALGLARAGARVMVTAARERGEVDAVAAQALSECGEASVLPIVADVGRDDDCARVVEATHDAFGPVDILVNNPAAE